MSVEDGRQDETDSDQQEEELITDKEFEEEEPGMTTVAVDGEGEIIYDINASRPDYKLFSLRNNSCLDYHSLIEFDANHGSSNSNLHI